MSVAAVSGNPVPILRIRQTDAAVTLRISQIGIRGPSGSDGAPPTLAEFLTPSKQWIVNHNLGWNPLIAVLSLGNVEVVADVHHVSEDQLIINFAAPFAGRVIAR